MPIFVKTGIIAKSEFYINGNQSIKYFLDWVLTIVIALYSGKLVSVKTFTMDGPEKMLSIKVNVVNWTIFYKYTFRSFIEDMSKCFEYKGERPFTIELLPDPTLKNYIIFINYNFYTRLDAGFTFPNLNGVIKKLLDDYMVNPCYEFEPRVLTGCKFEYPLTVFIKPSIVETMPLSNKRFDGSLKMEARQMRQTNEMLSQMIETIYSTMINEDYTRLQAVIFEVHAIYASKKRDRSDDSEEVPSQKPRFEAAKQLEATVYD